MRTGAELARYFDFQSDSLQQFPNLSDTGGIIASQKNADAGLAVTQALADADDIFEFHYEFTLMRNNLAELISIGHIGLPDI
jgi:hypothetical protein